MVTLIYMYKSWSVSKENSIMDIIQSYQNYMYTV